MESRTLRLLEFPQLLEYLSSRACSQVGAEACLSLSPLETEQGLQAQSQLLREALTAAKQWLAAAGAFPGLEGVFAYLEQEGDFLDSDGLWGVAQVLDQAAKVQEALSKLDQDQAPGLLDWATSCPWPEKTAAGLKRCLGPDGRLTDESSPGLLEVRGEIRRIQQQCTKKVQEVFQDDKSSAYLQDEYCTISSDRYVLALKANFKGKLPGIVHDYSQSGDTCYLEPFFLVDLNNLLQDLKHQEREEEREVLRYVTGLIQQELDPMQGLYEWLVDLDVLAAKVRLAQEMQGTVLVPEKGGPLRLMAARHPLLVLQGQGVQPVDLSLDQGQQALVISGGNAGGKTVCLKTLGLLAVMAHSALPVSVGIDSALPFWSNIFAFLGDEQSLEDHLSTFTAQIGHFQRTWPRMDASCLVVLDEFGAGTDPSQGAALAQAVLDALLDKGVWIVAATHFPALKAYALGQEGVRAASVLFDPKTRQPLYRLAYDQVGASQALDVARDQGLPEVILNRAQEYLLLESEATDHLLQRLNRLAAERQGLLEELEAEKADLQRQRQQLKARFEDQAQGLLKEIKASAQEVVREWKARKKGRKKTLESLAQMRREIKDQKEQGQQVKGLSWQGLRPGRRLIYTPWSKPAVVEDVDQERQRLKIDLGGISLWAGLGEVRDQPQGVNGAKDEGIQVRSQGQAPALRLDLRGLRADEARMELERFLDQAQLQGRRRLEVVHGKGEGVLRATVHDSLRQAPGVSSFALGRPEQGGEGLTEVELE